MDEVAKVIILRADKSAASRSQQGAKANTQGWQPPPLRRHRHGQQYITHGGRQ